MSECPHVPGLPRPEPAADSDTCLECRAIGSDYVHLRMCLSCGHVGCCDSSPHQHASRHFEDTGHPVMRSFEPGESWRWCFVDQTIA
ncbi:UBP-type zinc finger domain-containing protein [Streptomyces pathocidini]|uniref:UBP-type zinc finger domain-containing protein n=1 Tax=Streptomyces pathocidini TaxID=1650571 RepID=A0ABW7UMM8_9ACTN|nr:UBP-type zinc finger domain-containing protein [Streptomyces pathocidini]